MKMTKVFEDQWIRFIFLGEVCVGRTHYKDSMWMVGSLDSSGSTFHLAFEDVSNPELLSI